HQHDGDQYRSDGGGADHQRHGGRTDDDVGSAGAPVCRGHYQRPQYGGHRYADHHAEQWWHHRHVERQWPQRRHQRRLPTRGGGGSDHHQRTACAGFHAESWRARLQLHHHTHTEPPQHYQPPLHRQQQHDGDQYRSGGGADHQRHGGRTEDD